MKILENRAVAIVLMVVLIAAGFMLGGYKSLNSLYEKNVLNIFCRGEDNDGVCIDNDLSERASDAINMAKIASKYDNAEAEMKDAQAAAAKLQSMTDIKDKAEANKELEAAVGALFTILEGEELSPSDASYVQRLYTDFNSRNETISHDPYNKYALEYNSIIGKFPAALIPAKEAEIFY